MSPQHHLGTWVQGHQRKGLPSATLPPSWHPNIQERGCSWGPHAAFHVHHPAVPGRGCTQTDRRKSFLCTKHISRNGTSAGHPFPSCSLLYFIATHTVKLNAVFHLCFVLTTVIPVTSIYISGAERFFIILIVVLGPARERNLTQAQAPNFLGGQALRWKYLNRAFIIQVTNAAIILPGDMKYKTTLQIKVKCSKHIKDGGQHFQKCLWKGLHK